MTWDHPDEIVSTMIKRAWRALHKCHAEWRQPPSGYLISRDQWDARLAALAPGSDPEKLFGIPLYVDTTGEASVSFLADLRDDANLSTEGR